MEGFKMNDRLFSVYFSTNGMEQHKMDRNVHQNSNPNSLSDKNTFGTEITWSLQYSPL